jgi:outer membrane usher protein
VDLAETASPHPIGPSVTANVATNATPQRAPPAPVTQIAPNATSAAASAGNVPPISSEQRAFVTLHVDGLDQGETIALLEIDDVRIPVSTLDQAGVHGFKGTRTTTQGAQYVSLASLAPGITYKFDQEGLALDITVSAAYLGSLALDLRPARPAHVEYTNDRSAYLNYSVTATGTRNSDAFVETGYNWGSSTFYNSINVASGQSIVRGLTYVQSNDRVRTVSRTYGDVLAQTGELGGSVFIGGISASRAFNLDPYVVHFPQPNVTGAVTAPAVADVYVNGILVRQVDLPPGNFNLNNVPATSGNANTKVVVTDAFGHVQTFTQSYYSSTDVLLRGTSDFEYAAGLIHQNAFSKGDSYGPAALLGRYRFGLSNQLTLGGRFEASAGLVSLGASAEFRLPIGLFHAGLAYSRDYGLSGAGMSLGYSYSAPRFGFQVQILDQTPSYANASQTAASDRTLEAFSAVATSQIGKRSNASIEYFRRADRDSGINAGIAINDTIQFRKFSLALTGTRSFSSGTGPQTGITAVLNFSIGRVSASLTHEHISGDPAAGGGTHTTLQIQGTPKGVYGPGYILNVNATGPSPVSGTIADRTPFGDASLDFGAGGGSPFSDTVRLSGGLTYIAGGVYPTRPDNGAFALVEVPGVAGVHVFMDNEDAAKTNRSGKALVSGLLPYYGNTIRIEDEDAPLDASIQTVQRLIAPPYKGGALVVFPVQRLQAMVGKLRVMVKGQPVVPAFGELDVISPNFQTSSNIGDNGEFYLENVPAGKFTARVLFKQGTCSFTLESPKSVKILLDLGTLDCVMP